MPGTLETLKKFDLEHATVTLWTFKKSTGKDKNPVFTGRWVDTSDALNEAIKSAVQTTCDGINESQEYGLLAQNNEGSVLTISTLETHAGLILAQAADEVTAKKVTNLKEISNAGFYALKLVSGDEVIYAVRRTDDSWKAKKSLKIISAVFSDHELGLDNKPGFNLSKYVDFFIVGENVLICSKPSFESILSYKQAHKEDFGALQSEPEFSVIFTDMQPLIAYVGDNKIQLRRASAIRQKGHYRNPEFMASLRAVHAQFGLNITFSDAGKIVPSPETCKDIFQALLDHRLMSHFSHRVYDVQNTADVAVN